MPDLSTNLHLTMLEKRTTPQGIYGLEWGDPDTIPHLSWIRDNFCKSFVRSDHVCAEIGPGGGRWTRYMLGFSKIYAVDYHQELLDELARTFRYDHITHIKNNGTDFPGVPDGSVDFVFSFGVFVHLEPDIADNYLSSMRRILKPAGRVVLQYADKSKPMAAGNKGFANNRPALMRQLVMDHGYFIEAENLTVLPHSAIIQFACGPDDLASGQVFTG